MLYTCGLLSVGPQCRDEEGDGEFHPLHGRYHGQSASGRYGLVKDGVITVGGTVRETEQWRHALAMTRRIAAPAWGSELLIEDRMENLTPRDTQYMLLYYVNFEYPLLAPETRLVLPESLMETSAEACMGLGNFMKRLGRACPWLNRLWIQIFSC